MMGDDISDAFIDLSYDLGRREGFRQGIRLAGVMSSVALLLMVTGLYVAAWCGWLDPSWCRR